MSGIVVRGGRLITPDGERNADLSIEDGRIAAIAEELPGAETEIDARGLVVLPGVIDVHLHFNEPGRADWEGAATGSRALAAGGGTVFFDMPLNSTPCTVNGREVDHKREALEAASIADFGLWGGLVPGSVPEMAEMAAKGVVGFKAFMCDSGLPEFPRADDSTLLDGLREAARLDLPVAVHAESDEMVRQLAQQTTARTARAFLDSRPVAAEVEAIERAVQLAADAHAKLHIVHVSSGRGVAAALAGRARGVDVSIETCPHYLFFVDDDLERLGTVAKCAPPLRAAAEQEALWEALEAGHVDIVASDHSPTLPALKAGDVFAAWGGIAGVQSTLPVLLSAGCHVRGLPLTRLVSLLAAEPATRFRIARKGRLAVGGDADLAIVDLDERHALRVSDLHQRHKITPYLKATFRGRVRRTLRRGDTIFLDGRITNQEKGRLVRPNAT
ncbi:MAG TPA: allantoinase AllB [Vicinamibacterales bacterium]|jgi:allantoinase|nr:allantoinase AllB [Vicinamibacterales bacterium]